MIMSLVAAAVVRTYINNVIIIILVCMITATHLT